MKLASKEDSSVTDGGAILREKAIIIDAPCKRTMSPEMAVQGVSPLGQPTTASSCFTVVSPDIPKVFNFCEKSSNKSSVDDNSVRGEECSGEEVERGGVFLFTASPSKSGGSVGEERREGEGEGEEGREGEGEAEEEDVIVKHKPLALVYPSEGGGGEEEEEGGRGRHNEEVAVLAQQLQLDSDNVCTCCTCTCT